VLREKLPIKKEGIQIFTIS